MIHELGRELQTRLRALGCPFAVVDREDTTTTTYGRERIVIEHDGDDEFSAPHGQHVNPKHVFTVTTSLKLTIYAQSTGAGATEWEHRRRVEHVRDLVLAALKFVCSVRRVAFVPTRGHLVRPPDLEESKRDGGAAYELSFTIDRGVPIQTFKHENAPTMTLAGGLIKNSTKVSAQGGPDDDDDPNTIPISAETACGS